MVLKYIIEYLSNDNNYATLIKDLADKSGYKINIVRANGAIIIYIDEDEDKIKTFFTLLGNALPLSVYVGQSRVEEAASFPAFESELQKAKLWSTCFPSELSKTIDETNAEYLNPYIFAQNGNVQIGEAEFAQSDDKFKSALNDLAQKIANGENVRFENENGSFCLSKNEPIDGFCKSIFCIDLNKIAPEYRIANVALFALSSMERPFVTVATTDASGESLFTRFTLSSDPFLLCIAKLIGDLGVTKLFFTQKDDSSVLVKYVGFASKNTGPEVLIHKDRKLFLSNEKYDNSILPIAEDSLIAYFGESGDASFLAQRPDVHAKDLLKVVSFSGSPMDDLSSAGESGVKLIENFNKHFAGLIDACGQNISGYDFEKFIRYCAVVLGCKEEKGHLAYLVTLANASKAPSGVKIDFVLETEGAPTLNLIKSFRTLLSYKIAGVEDTILAYSIFESFADFIAILSDEARKGFDAKELVLCGGMFYSQILSDRVFTKARNIRVSSAYIPQILI